MPAPILATKLHIPPPRPNLVARPRLLERMNQSLHCKLTLVSAPAGFGKTTLVTTWISDCASPVAWVALDTGENDPMSFLMYLVAALQTIVPDAGSRVMAMLQAPQPPQPETILTALLNEMAAVPHAFVLVLDDYHVIDATAVDDSLAFLLEYMPRQMHLIITTREDPAISLARLRARGELLELRAADLRFTGDEAAEFLKRTAGLTFTAAQVAALDARTEGWIAGLQLAALSMQGHHDDRADFIQSFTGSHRFVMDYLVEEVLQQQPPHVQTFLLRTSILERLCAPLCDAVVDDDSASGQETLEYLEQANLFLVPLDNERRWYRYHHLFAELLRHRLAQQLDAPRRENGLSMNALHMRAGRWFEENGMELEAFHHATAAHDMAHTIRLIEGKGMPLQFRGGAVPILNWLQSLPRSELDAHPVLWITWGSALLTLGQVVGVEEKAAAAEAALQDAPLHDQNRDLIGRIASLRTTLAVTQHDVDAIIAQGQRALAYLRPDNLPVRASINWARGNAYRLRGDRAAAVQAYTEALDACKAVGHTVIAMMATLGLGLVQESDNHLHRAHETYQSAVDLVGDAAAPPICDAYLGQARISYQWNDLDRARIYGEKGLELARQIETADRAVHCEVFLAKVKGAQGDLDGALAMLHAAERVARRRNFTLLLREIVAAQIFWLLRQGNVTAAAQLTQGDDLPLSQARVFLAQGNAAAALARLADAQQQAEARAWADERLKSLVLQAVAHHADGAQETALRVLHEALAPAKPDGFIRLFIDEGPIMHTLLTAAHARGMYPAYTRDLVAACAAEPALPTNATTARTAQPLVEALSERELEILALIVEGLKNQEIADQLFISLNTVLYHTKNIYGKLGVNTRAKAIARARELALI